MQEGHTAGDNSKHIVFIHYSDIWSMRFLLYQSFYGFCILKKWRVWFWSHDLLGLTYIPPQREHWENTSISLKPAFTSKWVIKVHFNLPSSESCMHTINKKYIFISFKPKQILLRLNPFNGCVYNHASQPIAARFQSYWAPVFLMR